MSRDAPRGDGPRRAGGRRDGAGRDGPRQDGPRLDGARRDRGGQDGARQDGAGRAGARRRAPSSRAQRGGSRPARRVDRVDVHDPDGVRLHKLLAEAGVGSRRACEQLLVDGRVSVDGHVVTELGVRVDPTRRVVTVDGERVVLDASRVYLAFSKPRGVVSTMRDERGRPCVGHYVTGVPERLFHVGRLDADTEGLLLLTNDGPLAHRLTHPAHEVPKTYVATVRGPVPKGLGRRLRDGIVLEDGPVAVDAFRVVDSAPGKALVEVVLHEGRKHVVRRLLDAVGHPVEALVRTRVGPVELGALAPGRTRRLTREEVGGLYRAGGL